jgi:hypothetical protein
MMWMPSGAIRGVMTDIPDGEKSRTVPVTGDDTLLGSFPLRTVNTTVATGMYRSLFLRSFRNIVIPPALPSSLRRGAAILPS